MDHRLQNARHVGPVSQADLLALGNPLDFLAEDHMRERQICAMLDDIATGTQSTQNIISDAIAFFQEELPFHQADEEQDLFPLMVQRCEPSDEIEKAIARLRSERNCTQKTMPEVVRILRTCGSDETTIPETKDHGLLRDFSGHARRHLIFENAIILPIARARLTEDDMKELLLRMLRRRGLDRVMEQNDAE